MGLYKINSRKRLSERADKTGTLGKFSKSALERRLCELADLTKNPEKGLSEWADVREPLEKCWKSTWEKHLPDWADITELLEKRLF